MMGSEPLIKVNHIGHLAYHGNQGYGGWAIPCDSLTTDSVVVDIGLGEDISFSEQLIAQYGCHVNGFDPTPKSINYINKYPPRISNSMNLE